MKLLLFSDIHASKKYCQDLVEMADDVDVVIGAGDFGKLRLGIKKTIRWLSGIKQPALIVPGNAESYDELRRVNNLWPSATVLHGSGIDLMGVKFFGIGGGIPITPFGSWSYDFSEEEAEDLLKECPEQGVLITHSPPKGLVDTSSRGQHLGSESIRKVVEEKKPRLVVCGHIHESGGKSVRMDDTVIVNAGPHGLYYDL